MRNVIVQQLRNKRTSRGQHAGLLLQRYLCENATGEEGNPEEKRAILHAAINAAKNDVVRQLYRSAFERLKASVRETRQTIVLKTASRLIVGLGSENVLETGIRLHQTYGMPIVPGSALKGLAAHYCDQVWGAVNAKFKKPSPTDDQNYRKYLVSKGPKPDDNYHRLLFGNTDDSGCIIFHDAWYVPDSNPKPLRMDVMTPHHPKWLDGAVPPTDFDSPKPVPFLSVEGSFCIAVSWHGPECPQATAWTQQALNLLCDALLVWGVGGKTSSGYGRLVRDEEAIRREEQKRRELEEAARKAEEEKKFKKSLESDSEELRQLKLLQREQQWERSPGDQNMLKSLEEFIEKHPNPPQDCLDYVREWLESIPNYQGVWDDPDAMRGKKKDKPKYGSAKIRELVKRMNPKS